VKIYDFYLLRELENWRINMRRGPSFRNQFTKTLQNKINSFIPEKVHIVVTRAIKQMVRGVIFGAGFITKTHHSFGNTEMMELKVKDVIKNFASGAAIEGAVTGAGGIFLGLADFPLWLSIKMKMVFEIAAHYGFDTKDYKERIYILYIFQMTFSSQQRKNEVINILENWQEFKKTLPDDLNHFDWRTFQLDYRDYIDLAKLFQLIPGVGAAIGAVVNHRLTNRLGINAMNAYRLRLPHIVSFINKQPKIIE